MSELNSREDNQKDQAVGRLDECLNGMSIGIVQHVLLKEETQANKTICSHSIVDAARPDTTGKGNQSSINNIKYALYVQNRDRHTDKRLGQW